MLCSWYLVLGYYLDKRSTNLFLFFQTVNFADLRQLQTNTAVISKRLTFYNLLYSLPESLKSAKISFLNALFIFMSYLVLF